MSRERSFTIRPVAATDGPALASLYAQSVRHLGPLRYTAAQIEAWSAFALKRAEFDAWVQSVATSVAVDGDEPIGFAGLAPDGRVASLYVAPAWQRRGVATALLEHLRREAVARGLACMTTEASHFSVPLFAKLGFRITGDEHVLYDGVEFHRFLMRQDLNERE